MALRDKFSAQVRRLELIKDQVCIRARRGYGGSLHLDFGTLGPPGVRGHQHASWILVCDCPWRLDSPDQVIVGFHDPQELVWTRIQVVVGKRFGPAVVLRPSYMFTCNIGADLVLHVFPDDAKLYTVAGDFPNTPWYVTGRLVPDIREEITQSAEPPPSHPTRDWRE
jgi:hypothetical protein